jgi:hypothetical protein
LKGDKILFSIPWRRIILDESTKKTLGQDRSKEKFTTVKYMPKGYVSPAAIDVFKDYTYIFLWEEKPFVFMIKNKIIAESFKTYFNLLWRMGLKSKMVLRSSTPMTGCLFQRQYS